MTIFEFEDYKKWVREVLRSMPKEGRGQLKRIADAISASPTIVTQVFNGDRELTPEQAIQLSAFFGLSKPESKYLLTLVNYARAGSHLYRTTLKQEIEELRIQSRELSNRVSQNFTLSEEAKSTFYANWYYTAVWSLTAIEGFSNAEKIAERLSLPIRRVREALEFLQKYGFVVKKGKNGFTVGPSLLHLESGSPHIPRHHQNWRLQAFRHYESPGPEDAFYTAPVTLSAVDAKEIRRRVLEFVATTVDKIKDSPSERLYCLNIDWFEI